MRDPNRSRCELFRSFGSEQTWILNKFQKKAHLDYTALRTDRLSGLIDATSDGFLNRSHRDWIYKCIYGSICISYPRRSASTNIFIHSANQKENNSFASDSGNASHRMKEEKRTSVGYSFHFSSQPSELSAITRWSIRHDKNTISLKNVVPYAKPRTRESRPSSALTFTVSIESNVHFARIPKFGSRKSSRPRAVASFISREATRISRGAHIIQLGRAARVALSRERLSPRRRAN